MSSPEEDDGFIKNVSGDEDFDAFERKLEDSYQKHMAKGGSRPTSHNSRPETASRKKRDEERRDKMTVDSQVTPIEEDLEHSKQMEAGNKKHSRDEKQESKEDRKINSHSNAQQNLIDQQFHSRQKSASMENQDFYDRFCRFIEENEIDRNDFCKDINIYQAEDELLQCFLDIKFPITSEEVHSIFVDFKSEKHGLLNMEDFYAKLTCWANFQQPKQLDLHQENQKFEDLKNEAQKMIENSSKRFLKLEESKKKKKVGKKKLLSRPMSSNVYMYKSNEFGSSQTSVVTTNMQLKNKSNFYLKQARVRRDAEEKELNLAIDKGKRKQEFECLHKMSEASEIAKILREPITFTTKKSDNTIKIIKILFPGEADEIREEVSLEEFMREYNKLKRKQNSVKNTYSGPFTQRINQTVSQSAIVSSYSKNRINKKERQEQLKEVLLQTMQLTKKLKEQLKILENKGVCGI